MADPQQQQQDEDLILSFFPDPPPFYRHFTAENRERLGEIEKEAATGDGELATSALGSYLSAEQILALPTELRYLIPPAPPADDEEFKVFGEATKAKGSDLFSKNMELISHRMKEEGVLQDWTYEQLYHTTPPSQPTTTSTPTTLDRQNYLFRFLRSMLLSYISLLGLVAIDPVSPAKDDQIAHILTMVTNMHALINEYRPHQARETLIAKMEEQLERKVKEVEGVRKVGERVRGVLEGFKNAVPGEKDEAKVADTIVNDEDRAQMTQAHMWGSVDEILG
ncbi:uncharacterized protein K460DRAFT_266774, partial [Cucurbitaria berberidis CBS 394.84]